MELKLRGMSLEQVVHYLVKLGGRPKAGGTQPPLEVEGDGWQARLTRDWVELGSLRLREITVELDGHETTLSELVERFRKLSLRAGG